jgi:CubicO group peptidase (beta-lactamase class C family)
MAVRWYWGLIAGSAALAAATNDHTATQLRDDEIRTFVDSFMAAELGPRHIPGAAFVFVRDGKIVAMRGYGLADVERRTPVIPESTIFRIGSISKVMTAMAVLQLADRGRIDLSADPARYVKRVSIPTNYPQPITVEQLLTHTAGFDEIRPGTQAPTRDAVLPFPDFLATRLVRVRPPNETIAYSTYGVTLAGELVEEVSGLPIEDYLTKEIWRPLGMTRTNINVPDSLRKWTAIGYEYVKDTLRPQPWEWYHTTPASSVNATTEDMGRFIIAQLAKGNAALSDRALRNMQRQHVTMHPRIPGVALGFYENSVGELRFIEHGGDVAGFSSLLVLLPSENIGFFMTMHLEGNNLRDLLKERLLQRLYPSARRLLPVPAKIPDDGASIAKYAGRYAPTSSCHSCRPRSVPYIMNVTANPDGTVGVSNKRWIRVEDEVFVREDGTGEIAFRTNATGAVTHMFWGGVWSFEKLP